MKLSEQEAEVFFKLMSGLLLFVNNQTGGHAQLSSVGELELLPQEEKLAVRDELFENPEYIDRYVQQNPQGFHKTELNIISSWKKFVVGDFFIERLLKKHAIFINEDQVYAVLALHTPFDDYFDRRALPLYVRAVLLPFKGRIVYDGLLEYYSVSFGRNISWEVKEVYLKAKQNQTIIKNLEDTRFDGQISPPPPLPDWSSEIDQLNAIAKRLRSSKGSPAVWSPAFSLVRASIALAEKAVNAPEELDGLWEAIFKVEQTLNRTQTVLHRSEC